MTNDEIRGRASENRTSKIKSRKSTILLALACLPPVIAVAVFAVLWGGLTPPSFRAQHAGGINLAMAPLALALTGAFGIFFLPAAWNASRARAWGALAAVAVGAVVALSITSNYDKDAGRWGGAMWELTHRLPAPMGRSILFVLLAPVGTLALWLMYRKAAEAGRRRPAMLLLVALGAWLTAQCFNSQAWQRYAEPIVLMTLAVLACMGRSNAEGSAPAGGRWWLGPAALATLLLAYNLIVTYSLLPSPLR